MISMYSLSSSCKRLTSTMMPKISLVLCLVYLQKFLALINAFDFTIIINTNIKFSTISIAKCTEPFNILISPRLFKLYIFWDSLIFNFIFSLSKPFIESCIYIIPNNNSMLLKYVFNLCSILLIFHFPITSFRRTYSLN